MATSAITLTYGRNSANDADHERAVLLTYSDAQKYFKLLRRHGHDVRYHITGEYGSLFGRAHWHTVMHWQNTVPKHVLDRNFIEDHWPHGWSFWTEPSFAAIRYNCKYIMKDQEDGRQGHMAMSKKPPLGAQYFRELAEEYVREGISPQSPEYRFAGVTRLKKDGTREVIPFWLKGRALELFIEHFIAEWDRAHPRTYWPTSAMVDLYHEYGRVVWDEESASERAREDRIADAKFNWMVEEAQRQAEKPTILRHGPRSTQEWWTRYMKDAPDGEERQKRQAEYERWERQQDADALDQFRDQFTDYGDSESYVPGGDRLQGEHERKRQCESECSHPTDRPDYGHGKVGTWNKHYPKPDGEPV